MGCISSKEIIARSISFHEERKQRSHRTVNGIPLLEDFIISANGSDKYLTLVRAANSVSNKLNSRSYSSNKSSKLAIELATSETVEKLELSAKLGQVKGKQFESDFRNRSKSWHYFPEHIVRSLAQENLSGFEDKHDLSSKGAVGSRSFHTVEEYDGIVNKIWLNKSNRVQQRGLNEEDDSGANMDIQVLEYSHVLKSDISVIMEMQPESNEVTPSPKSHIPSSGIKNEEMIASHKTRVLAAQGVRSTIEKGNKRKALAKRLESLKIPSTIESPAIASLREWLPADGIYSSGSYVTPKFGSYSLMNTRIANESSEDSIFSPELVSAFEQCMQNLDAEEEKILKQILENVEEESDERIQPQERTHVLNQAGITG